MRTLRFLLIVTALFCYSNTFAQATTEPEELSLDKGTIESQFNYISKKSGNYRAEGIRYEVVKISNLLKIKKNVLDTISKTRIISQELKTTIISQKETIGSLNTKLEETTKKLGATTVEKDSMSFFGIQISKGGYNVIMWIIVLILLVLFMLFVVRFRRSNILTQEAKLALAELETEYEEHRRKSLEREQKISRKLQDELNKQKK